MTKYSYQELAQIENDINTFINKQESVDNRLMFKLRTNLKKIKDAKQVIEEDFKVASDEEKEKLGEFQDKKLELVKEFDGELKQLPNGNVEIVNADELNNNEEFTEKLSELFDEYEEIINQVRQYDKENFEHSQEKVAEVEFVDVPLDLFPSDVDEAFSERFLEFVKE